MRYFTTSIAVLTLWSGEAATAQQDAARRLIEPCTSKAGCELEGQLEIVAPGYALDGATLTTGQFCMPLLFSAEQYRAASAWNGQKVRVIGTAGRYAEPPDLHWWQFKDRRIQAGACLPKASEGVFLYVDAVSAVGR